MQAVFFDQKLQLVERPKPKPAPGEALIRVKMAGICNTDLEILHGYMGFRGVLGHEFVGVVEACDNSDWIGQRVVGEINLGCGVCPDCATGLARHCANRQVLGIAGKDGVFADYVTLPVSNLHIVPRSVSDRAALLTEPLAAACEILEQVHIRPVDRVAVVGDGKLSWMAAQVLRLTGASLVVHGKHPERCARFQEIGIQALTEAPPAQAYDCVVEASGSVQGLDAALAACRPRGTVILKSTVASSYEINMAPLVINEITLMGSRCGRFEPALRLLEQKQVEVESLLSSLFRLADFEAAFEAAQLPQAMKIAFDLTHEAVVSGCP